MLYIKDLINKIKWDKREDPADYTIIYFDRADKKRVEIKFTEIKKIVDTFFILERNTEEVSIPLHRIRQVKKKEEVVWER